MNRNFIVCVFGALAMIVTGCGGDQAKKGSGEGPGDVPGWFMAQPPLCGVGVQKFRGNLGSTKTFAEGKARDDLSRQLETKVRNMIKQYSAEGQTGDGDFSEEKSVNVSKQLSKKTLRGARPKKAYFSQDKQFYSLVCLDPGVLTDAIKGMEALNKAERAALARRAEKEHADLDKEMEKYND